MRPKTQEQLTTTKLILLWLTKLLQIAPLAELARASALWVLSLQVTSMLSIQVFAPIAEHAQAFALWVLLSRNNRTKYLKAIERSPVQTGLLSFSSVLRPDIRKTFKLHDGSGCNMEKMIKFVGC